MKSNFAHDVRNLETQARAAVETWRAQGDSRKRTVYALPDSAVRSAGHQEEWRHVSRHIEIAVADAQPFFALVESERVTDTLGQELRRSPAGLSPQAIGRVKSFGPDTFELMGIGWLSDSTK